MNQRRERIIVDVHDLEGAAKVEETISTGYCDVIAENLANWVAVEEDMIDSYRGFPREVTARLGREFGEMVEESGQTVAKLRVLLEAVEQLRDRRALRVKALRKMQKTLAS